VIGLVVDEFSFAVEAGKVSEFARAIHDPAPRYDDPTDGVPAPLTFTVVAAHHRDAPAAVAKLGLDIKRVVVGEVEWSYERPVIVGDHLSARRVVADVKTREGSRGGTMTLVTLETEFRDAAGEVALRQREVLIETGGV
jgi:hydroxyacyl-ACP dehydratase HTD2-like protein with hotdog domain